MTADRFDDAYIPDLIPEEDLAIFERGGYGARMGWGESPAVVVVDMVEAFTSSEYLGRTSAAQAAVDETDRLLGAARAADLPVFYTRLPREEAIATASRGAFDLKKVGGPSTWDPDAGYDIHPDIAPTDEDVVIEKPKPSAFFDTHFGNILRHLDVDTLVITGVSTSGGVRATVLDAISSNFHAVVPQECVADRASVPHEVALFDMDMKFADVTPVEEVIETIESRFDDGDG